MHPLLRICTGLLLGALLVATAPLALARTVLDLDTHTQPVNLQDWGDYWIDKTGLRTPEQVSGQPGLDWKPTLARQVYPLEQGHVLWVRFSVPPAPDAERWYLEIPAPSVNRASLYTLDSADRWNEQRAGDRLAVNQWPVPHRHPLLPIAVSAEVPTKYLLRLENGHAFSAPLQFISEARLSHSEQRVSLILGIFFGLTGLAVLISALSALSLRDPAYGFYALSVALMSLTQASHTGIAGLHLWPGLPRWNDAAPLVLPMLELAATLLFVSAAVSLPERSRRLHHCLTALAAVCAAVALALTLVPLSQRMTLFTASVFVPQLLILYALLWAWRRGDRFAHWLMLGFLPAIAAGAVVLAHHAGLVPAGLLTQHGAQIGVAIELPIIMVILMLRSQHRRENTRRIQGLDRIDPSTGLINGHVFGARLNRMIARSMRLRHQSAVMLIDIVNTEQLQRDFGRKAAEEMPLRVAERLLSIAREIDSIARLSERRFGMLAEGPFRTDDAFTLAPRIVAHCLMPYPGLHVDCVAQIRLAYAMVPAHGSDGQDVLDRLDRRLAGASSEDRRAVFMLKTAAPPAAAQRGKPA